MRVIRPELMQGPTRRSYVGNGVTLILAEPSGVLVAIEIEDTP